MTVTDRPGAADWASLLTLSLLWGSSFLAAKIALGDFGPMQLAAGRIVLGAAILLAVVAATGRPLPRGRRIWLSVLGFAVFSNSLPFFLLNWAQQTVPSSFAGVVMATVPLFVLPMAIAAVPGERFRWPKLAGLVAGLAGVVVLVGPGEAVSGPAALLPRLACVGAAICYATGSIVTRLAPIEDQIAFSAVTLGLAALISVPVALAVEGLPGHAGPAPLAALLALGIGPTALAAILLVRTIRSAGPTFVSVVNYLVPVWAVILGAAILAEPLPATFLTGALLILAGLAISQWSSLRASFGR